MTQLILPHTIDPGTAIVANEHQENNVAIRDIINGGLDQTNLTAAFDAKLLKREHLWYALGTETVAAGATVLVSTGSEALDPGNNGDGNVYTVPRTALYLHLVSLAVTDLGVDQRARLISTANGVDSTTIEVNSTTAGHDPIVAGWNVRGTLSPGATITAKISNLDSASRSFSWRQLVLPLN